MAWDDITENESHGEYTKFEPNKSVTLHIIGDEPKRTIEHWVGNKSVQCNSEGCENCVNGVKRSVRFTIAVYNLTTNRKEILKQGTQVFSQIKAIRDAYNNDISKLDMQIKRTGSGAMDTEYTVVPIPTKFNQSMLGDEKVPF